MKTKFQAARDEKCAMYYKDEKTIAFKLGADWGAGYERERAAKLEKPCRYWLEIIHSDYCDGKDHHQMCLDFTEAIQAYEAEEK